MTALHSRRRRRCHCAIDFSGYPSNCRSCGPAWTGTQLTFEPSIKCVRSDGTGRSVSIAEANGCTSSGHCGSHSHSALPYFLQTCRRPELGVIFPVAPSRIFCPVDGKVTLAPDLQCLEPAAEMNGIATTTCRLAADRAIAEIERIGMWRLHAELDATAVTRTPNFHHKPPRTSAHTRSVHGLHANTGSRAVKDTDPQAGALH